MIRPPIARTMNLMRQLIRKVLLIITIILGWINMPAQAFLLSDQQNLWPILSQNFSILDDTDRNDIQRQIDTDLRHPRYIQKLTRNARPYLYYIYQETQKKHLPAELVLLPMIESEYTPSGYSSKGAVGLWQLMPGTAYNYGVKMNTWYDGRKSTTVSTKVALNFLTYLYDLFDHNWLLAIAAYNAGPGTVMAAVHYNEAHGRPTNFWALHLPKQTQEYIPKLLALAAIIQNPQAYGIHLSPVPNKAITTTVTIKKQMPIKTIAHMAHTSVNTVKKLNPALKRTETPPHQIVTLVLPANKKTTFQTHLKMQKEMTKKKLDHYTVQHGDSLSSIASKFKTTIDVLKEMNQLHSEIIRAHQLLLVPKVIHAVKEITTAEHKETKTAAIKPQTPTNNDNHEHAYIVRPGDNLHKLAEHFNTTTYHIIAHNHLRTATLSIGQHLLLPHA